MDKHPVSTMVVIIGCGCCPVENGGETMTGDYVLSGRYEINIAGKRYSAKPSLKHMYGPELEGVRC
ncbi:MAG TPA: hypothetical protein VLA72_19835 [Anaerolineales bacterium]|nr:hypothetical protein [Anaerolineales bacterium]